LRLLKLRGSSAVCLSTLESRCAACVLLLEHLIYPHASHATCTFRILPSSVSPQVPLPAAMVGFYSWPPGECSF
jgi:hypothetical protein